MLSLCHDKEPSGGAEVAQQVRCFESPFCSEAIIMGPWGNKQMSSSARQSMMMNNHGAADVEEAQPRSRQPQLEIINNRTTHRKG